MASVLRESREPVTLVATGPQTNVALLLASHPELHAKIARIVIGAPWGWATGSRRRSLISTLIRRPRKWSSSGIPVVMAGLDVTHRAQSFRRYRAIPPDWQPGVDHRRRLLDFFMAYHKDEKWG